MVDVMRELPFRRLRGRDQMIFLASIGLLLLGILVPLLRGVLGLPAWTSVVAAIVGFVALLPLVLVNVRASVKDR